MNYFILIVLLLILILILNIQNQKIESFRNPSGKFTHEII